MPFPKARHTGQSCLEMSKIFPSIHPPSLLGFSFPSLVKFLSEKSSFVSTEGEEKGLVHPEAEARLSGAASVHEAAGGTAGASVALSE